MAARLHDGSENASLLEPRSLQKLKQRGQEICMEKSAVDRRKHLRYGVRLPLHYHVSQKGNMARSGSGLTLNMSTNGVSFRCRKPLPLGAHIEMVIDWPAKYGDVYPVDLVVTGFIIRSDPNHTAIRMTSRKFRVADAPGEPVRISA